MYVFIPAKPITAKPTKASVSTGPEEVVDAVVPVDEVDVVPVVPEVVDVADVVVSVVGSSGGRLGRAGGESAARAGEARISTVIAITTNLILFIIHTLLKRC